MAQTKVADRQLIEQYGKLNIANTWTQDQSVPDEAYGMGWNGNLEVPTKNAIYDKVESLSLGLTFTEVMRLKTIMNNI
jgi:hypothetical protein